MAPVSSTLQEMRASATVGIDAKGPMDSLKVLNFLKEYKVFECAGCNALCAVQQRKTGLIYCIEGCHTACESSPLFSVSAGSKPKDNLGSEKIVAPGLSLAKNSADTEVPRAISGPTYDLGLPAMNGDAPELTTAKKEIKSNIPITATEQPELTYSRQLASGKVVKIVYAWSPTCFQVAAVADEKNMEVFQETLKTYCAGSTPLKNPPRIGDVVVALYQGDYYRGRVSKIVGDMCTVTFLDFGDIAECSFGTLFPVDAHLQTHPVYGLKISLYGVPNPPAGFTTEKFGDQVYEMEYTLELTNGKTMPEPGMEAAEAKLWIAKGESSFNEKLIQAFKKM